MSDLENKRVIITGGSRGIGLSILEKFYHEKAKIIAIASNFENLGKLKSKYPGVKTEVINLKNNKEVLDKFQKSIDILGGIDILINNAGITKDNLTIRMKEDEWKEVIDVNLNSVFLLCQLSKQLFPGDVSDAS